MGLGQVPSIPGRVAATAVARTIFYAVFFLNIFLSLLFTCYDNDKNEFKIINKIQLSIVSLTDGLGHGCHYCETFTRILIRTRPPLIRANRTVDYTETLKLQLPTGSRKQSRDLYERSNYPQGRSGDVRERVKNSGIVGPYDGFAWRLARRYHRRRNKSKSSSRHDPVPV